MKKLLSFLIILVFAVACADDPNKATSTSKYEKVGTEEDQYPYQTVEISFNSDNKPVRLDFQYFRSKGGDLRDGILETITYNKDGVAESLNYERYGIEGGKREVYERGTISGEDLQKELEHNDRVIQSWTKI